MLHLYDSKSARIQPLNPVTPGKVGIYLCGATVQGSPHVGHLRAAVSFDTLIRWLRRSGYQVTYVRNVTDIDDKILNKSAEAGWDWWAWAYRFEREFTQAYENLGVEAPTYEPRATGHIPEQLDLVQRLIDAGHAYSDGRGNVYFDVHSQPDYGSLTRQRLADMRTTEDDAQIDEAVEAGKRDPRDFALWKASKPSEPATASWDSPWGRGRPGWHLECSAMSRRYLGDEFDIHGGGIDLRFPHHENEQAQSHGAGWPFARLWVHNAWVTTKGEKMSKSLGNVLSIGALTEEYPAVAVRWALSTVHHRSAIEWGPETLPAAHAAWEKFSTFVARSIEAAGEADASEIVLAPADLPEAFVAAMDDDLNVAGALAVLHEHLKARHPRSPVRVRRVTVLEGAVGAVPAVVAGCRGVLVHGDLCRTRPVEPAQLACHGCPAAGSRPRVRRARDPAGTTRPCDGPGRHSGGCPGPVRARCCSSRRRAPPRCRGRPRRRRRSTGRRRCA